MARLIDSQGRLFGRINIIDFGCLALGLCMLPAIYFGYRILTKPASPPVVKSYYELQRLCPICNLPVKIAVKLGEQPDPDLYETVCPHCQNKVTLDISPLPNFNAAEELHKIREILERRENQWN